MLGLPVPEKTQLVRMMQGLGQTPFDPPNVKGWAGGESWITTYTLLLRQQFLRRMVEATTVSPMDGGMMSRCGPTAAPSAASSCRPTSDAACRWRRRARSRAAACATPATRRGSARRWPAWTPPTLLRTLLPRAPIDTVDVVGHAGRGRRRGDARSPPTS